MAYTLMCRLRGYMNKGVETDELRSGGALVLWPVARSERRRGESGSIEWTLWKVRGRVHHVRALSTCHFLSGAGRASYWKMRTLAFIGALHEEACRGGSAYQFENPLFYNA